jgi:transcriptional regulator with XRE-family HTH domain
VEQELRRRLAYNVRRYREAASLTLEVASERGDLNWRHWQKVEAGEVNATLRTLNRLANALDVDPGALLAELPGRNEGPPSASPPSSPR